MGDPNCDRQRQALIEKLKTDLEEHLLDLAIVGSFVGHVVAASALSIGGRDDQ